MCVSIYIYKNKEEYLWGQGFDYLIHSVTPKFEIVAGHIVDTHQIFDR